jgi:hypothetical protein
VDELDTNEESLNSQLNEASVEEPHNQDSSASDTTSSIPDPVLSSPNMSDGPNIVESVRSRGNRFGFRRFFEGEVRRAFNLTMKQAKSLFGDIAKESIRMEMQQMIEKGVWKPISWSEIDTTVIPSKMFLKEKKDVTKIKARLVAGGHLQNREDLLDNSSPTLAILSLLAAKFAHTVVTVDITGAYLNADMSDHVLLKINSDIAKYLIDIDPAYEAFQNEKGEIVVKLLKALYGCVQSSKLWYLTLKRLFIANGF